MKASSDDWSGRYGTPENSTAIRFQRLRWSHSYLASPTQVGHRRYCLLRSSECRQHVDDSQQTEPRHHKPIAPSSAKIKLCSRSDEPERCNPTGENRAGRCAQPKFPQQVANTNGQDGEAHAMIHDANDSIQVRTLEVVSVEPEPERRQRRSFSRQCRAKPETLREGE